jgi:hypothetical protein
MPPFPRTLRRAVAPSGLALLAATGLNLLGPAPASANTLAAIHRLEQLINAAGTETQVREDCRPNHAGYFERDDAAINRLVVCRNNVDMGDVEAVWEVMAHEGTHVMQACSGGPALRDTQMPRTLRELRTLAPHYAKLISEGYHPSDQRLEAEAFWMELQPADVVIALFEANCRTKLPRAER